MTTPKAFITHYLDACKSNVAKPVDPQACRFISMDCETTGLDSKRDRIITMGAISVVGKEIRMDDSLELMLPIAFNTATVEIHGITADAAREGIEESDAVEQFLKFVAGDILVGHHLGFDLEVLNQAAFRHFGIHLANRWLDTMEMALFLVKKQVWQPVEKIKDFSLDALCQSFGIIPHDRHTATGDAFITAQIFLNLRSIALKNGLWNQLPIRIKAPH